MKSVILGITMLVRDLFVISTGRTGTRKKHPQAGSDHNRARGRRVQL